MVKMEAMIREVGRPRCRLWRPIEGGWRVYIVKKRAPISRELAAVSPSATALPCGCSSTPGCWWFLPSHHSTCVLSDSAPSATSPSPSRQNLFAVASSAVFATLCIGARCFETGLDSECPSLPQQQQQHVAPNHAASRCLPSIPPQGYIVSLSRQV